MDDVSSEAAVHQPDILTSDPERSGAELVCEIEYEQARQARLDIPESSEIRRAAHDAAVRLAEARRARRDANG